MLLLDITIVNVALPDIAQDLGSSFSDLQWVIDAYALTLAALLLTAGSLADLLGRRRGLRRRARRCSPSRRCCAASPRARRSLDLARALQGIGGAAMFATSLALLAAAFPGRERGTAFGIWGATIGAAGRGRPARRRRADRAASAGSRSSSSTCRSASPRSP